MKYSKNAIYIVQDCRKNVNLVWIVLENILKIKKKQLINAKTPAKI